MDPDENLKEQLILADSTTSGESEAIEDDAERLAELVVAMSGWIRTGGFLPKAWSRRRA